MNIGFYNPRVGIYRTGGTEVFLRNIMKELSNDEEVTLYTGKGKLNNEVAEMDINIEQIDFFVEGRLPNRIISSTTPLQPIEIESLSMFSKARKSGVLSAMSKREDVISLHSLFDDVLVSRAVDSPSVFRIPALDLPSVRWRLLTSVEQADHWLTNSEWTAQTVESRLNRCVDGVVYAGVDLDQFSLDAAPAMSFDRPVVLYVGRLDPGKGLQDLLIAYRRLQKEMQVELVFVGDGSLRNQLENQVKKWNLTSTVTFVGAVPHEKIHYYYATGDVFCLPSYSEGFGLSNIEAMACGVPVVSTNVSAITEYIKHEHNGLLVSPGDVDAIQKSIQRLISNPDLRIKLADQARRDVQKFSWSNQAEQMKRHYLQTIGMRP